MTCEPQIINIPIEISLGSSHTLPRNNAHLSVYINSPGSVI